MSRSKSRLAADWFAKLRLNAQNQVEHTELVAVEAEVNNVSSSIAALDYYSPSNPPPSSAPTSAQILSAIAGASFGAVGTYVWAREVYVNIDVRVGGNTVAGSRLMAWASDLPDTYVPAARLSGTWMLMGNYSTVSSQNDDPESVFLRIA